MREGMGKYRGKRMDGNGWAYGSLWINLTIKERPVCIITEWSMVAGVNTPMEYRVDPETVGEFTGQIDIHGTEIYENARVFAHRNGVTYTVKHGPHISSGDNGEDPDSYGWYLDDGRSRFSSSLEGAEYLFAVVGPENPELTGAVNGL